MVPILLQNIFAGPEINTFCYLQLVFNPKVSFMGTAGTEKRSVLLKRILEDLGCVCVSCSSGLEGIRYLSC
jgi:hypothetical protein